MTKKKLMFVGNCQALAMANFYRAQIAGMRDEEVVYYDDFEIDTPTVRAAVQEADAVILQARDFARGLDQTDLRPGVEFRLFPMVLAGYLWPFADEPHVRNAAQPPFSDGPYPSQLGDSFLNRLIVQDVSPEAALEQYLALDIVRTAHVDRVMELYLDRQRLRDEQTGFETVSIVERWLPKEQLFLTSQHPNARMFGAVAAQLFEKMGISGGEIARAIERLRGSPFPPDELPLHPGIIRHFGLEYVDEKTRYTFHGEGRFTFAEYVLRYMRYAHNHALRAGISLAASDPARAIPLLTAGLAQSPESVRGLLAQGMALDRLGQGEEARASIARAAELEPDDPEPWELLARSLINAGAPDQAAAAAQRAVDIDPGYVGGYQLLGEARLWTEEPAASVDPARTAVRMLPGEAGNHFLLGTALARCGAWAEAEAAAGVAVRIAPTVADYRNLQATARETLGQRAGAIAILADGVAHGAVNAHSFSLLGNFYLRDGDLARAESAFSRGLELDPASEDLLVNLRMIRAMPASAGG